MQRAASDETIWSGGSGGRRLISYYLVALGDPALAAYVHNISLNNTGTNRYLHGHRGVNLMYDEPKVGTTERLAKTEAVRSRVEQDIEFLSARIAALKALPRPNQVVIDTYQTMLDSRRSVLKWFQHGRTAEPDSQHDRYTADQ